MKNLLLIFAFVLLVFNNPANASNETSLPEVDFIRDHSLFKPELDPQLSDIEKSAIIISRKEIEKIFGSEIRGLFSVAKSKTGYQVNFSRLEKKIAANKWQEVIEGFGEVFLSHELKVLYSAIGP